MCGINEELARVDQLKRQRGLQDRRERVKKEKIDTRRSIIVGEYVAKYFPEILCLQPQRNKLANDIEFEQFEKFLSALATNKELISQLKAATNS